MGDSSRTVALIPARLNSTRLPWKQLRPVQGNAMLWYLVERMKAVPAVDEIVVATTDRSVDAPLVDWVKDAGIEVFRGAHEDLLGRLYSAAREFDAELVIRANGDNPLLSPEVTTNGIELLKQSDVEFATGKCEYTDLPVGIGPELLRTSTLSKLASTASDSYYREHVTTYIFDNPDEFCWGPIPVRAEWKAPDLSVTVDMGEELEYVSKVMQTLSDRRPSDWGVEEVIAACRSVEGSDATRN